MTSCASCAFCGFIDDRLWIVLAPKQLTEKAPVPKLTPKEQKLLLRARQKIEKIRKDLPSSRGLTEEEADVAAKAGLIDPSQSWWWTEEWQKGDGKRNRRYGKERPPGHFRPPMN